MCVLMRVHAMGCGKSKHRSLEDSEIDLKNNKNSNHGNSKNGGSSSSSNKNSGVSGGSSSSKKEKEKESSGGSSGGSSSSSKKKKHFNDNKTSHKDAEKEEKSSPFKMLSNGKTSRGQSGRSEEVGVPAGLSASGKTNGSGGEKSNGTPTSNKAYSLEIPNEISKQESNQKTTCRDFKSLTSSKTVHVTNSQIEFFKMLDEKIEKGDEYTTSADVSEVSSLDDPHYRQ